MEYRIPTPIGNTNQIIIIRIGVDIHRIQKIGKKKQKQKHTTWNTKQKQNKN